MAIYQREIKLGSSKAPAEKKPTDFMDSATTMTQSEYEYSQEQGRFFQDVSTAWDIANMSYGEDIDIESRAKTFEAYEDYKDNEKFYKAYADNTSIWKTSEVEAIERSQYHKIVSSGKFMLKDGEVVPGENATPISMYMYDMDIIKGALLAQQHGYNEEVELQDYKRYTKQQAAKYAKELEGASTSAKVIGGIAGHIFREETALEIAMSPTKIMGTSAVRGAMKAFATEAGIAVIGDTKREIQIQDHMEKADLDYTLWDSVKNIMIGAGLAGSLRGLGSYGVDKYKIHKELKAKGATQEEREIVEEYFKRESASLTTNSQANIELLHKAEADINNGKRVDVEEFTDIDINTRTDDAVEEISLEEELTKADLESGYTEKVMKFKEEIVNSIENSKSEIIDDTFEGMATREQADKTISEAVEIAQAERVKNPKEADERYLDLEEELKAIQQEKTIAEKEKKALSAQAEALQDAAVPKIGGSEDEAKQATQQLMKKNKTPAANRTDLNKEEIEELERIHFEELLNNPKQEDILDAEGIFVKGVDNLIAGTIAGVEEDENGNITINPENFVLGLAGYTALKALAKNPNVQKEFKGYIERTLDELESRKGFDYFTGIQRIGLLEKSKAKRLEQGLPEKGGKKVFHPDREKEYFYHEETDTIYFQRGNGKWREMPNEETRADIKYIDRHGVKAFRERNLKDDNDFKEAEKEFYKKQEEKKDSWKDAHTAPTREQDGTTSIDDLTAIYPSDIYSKDAARFYGHNEKAKDDIAMYILRKIKGNPKAKVTIYRAIPEDIDADINVGDWVTITKAYAKEHGDARFNGKYKMLEKEVNAEDIITDGNSIHEQGYDPKGGK